MEAALLICIFAAIAMTVIGAPYMESQEVQLMRQYPEDRQYFREARSQFAAPQYVLPCAAAAAAAAAATTPMHAFASPNHFNVRRYAGDSYGSGMPHYRSVDEQMAEAEMLSFSDIDQMQNGQAMIMDHVPMARTSYGAMHSNLGLNGPALTSTSGVAYGVFPKAHVGGCNVPLLFSCSPSISSGHIMEKHQTQEQEHQSPMDTGNSYRLVDGQFSDSHEHAEGTQDQHLNPTHETSQSLQVHM